MPGINTSSNGQPPTVIRGQKTVDSYESGQLLGQESRAAVAHGRLELARQELGLQVAFVGQGLPEDQDQGQDVQQVDTQTEGVQLSMDWLSTTFHPSLENPITVSDVALEACTALGCGGGDWLRLQQGQHGYQKGSIGPGGAKLWWDAPGRDDFHLVFPGQACQMVGQERMTDFLKYCLEHGAKATRADVAIDDFDRRKSVDEIEMLFASEDCVTRADIIGEYRERSRKAIRAAGVMGQRNEGASLVGTTGKTVTLGSRASRQFLRVYDKGLESGGQLDAIRWELESKKEAAETMVVALANKEWGQVIRSRLLGYVDFREEASHSEVEKRRRLSWFQELVKGVSKASAYLPKVPRTIEQLVDWIDQSIGPSLAVAARMWGAVSLQPLFDGGLGQLAGIIANGEQRWKPRHRAMMSVPVPVMS